MGEGVVAGGSVDNVQLLQGPFTVFNDVNSQNIRTHPCSDINIPVYLKAKYKFKNVMLLLLLIMASLPPSTHCNLGIERPSLLINFSSQLGLSDLANKDTGRPVKFEVQLDNGQFLRVSTFYAIHGQVLPGAYFILLFFVYLKVKCKGIFLATCILMQPNNPIRTSLHSPFSLSLSGSEISNEYRVAQSLTPRNPQIQYYWHLQIEVEVFKKKRGIKREI